MAQLEKIYWEDVFSIGNSEMDLEHQRLLEIYNELIILIQNNKNRTAFAEILSKMTDYSLFHFKDEEEYMQKIKYPRYKEHKQIHKEFIIEVATFNTNLLSNTPPTPEEILLFIKEWWMNHILKEDFEYEIYKKNK